MLFRIAGVILWNDSPPLLLSAASCARKAACRSVLARAMPVWPDLRAVTCRSWRTVSSRGPTSRSILCAANKNTNVTCWIAAAAGLGQWYHSYIWKRLYFLYFADAARAQLTSYVGSATRPDMSYAMQQKQHFMQAWQVHNMSQRCHHAAWKVVHVKGIRRMLTCCRSSILTTMSSALGLSAMSDLITCNKFSMASK